MRPSQLWELVRRLAAAAGIAEWGRLSAHSLRPQGHHHGSGHRGAVAGRAGPRAAPRRAHHAALRRLPATVWTGRRR